MDFLLNQTWPTFYDYIPVYKISIQYTNSFKRYRTETICVTYGMDGADVRTNRQWWYYMPPPPPHWKWRGHKNCYIVLLFFFFILPRVEPILVSARFISNHFISYWGQSFNHFPHWKCHGNQTKQIGRPE